MNTDIETMNMLASVLADTVHIGRGLSLISVFFLAGMVGRMFHMRRLPTLTHHQRRRRRSAVQTRAGFHSRLLVLALAAVGLMTVAQEGAAILGKLL